MVNSEKGKDTKGAKDSYLPVMITQSVTVFVLIALTIVSYNTGGGFAALIKEGYKMYMADEFSGEDVSEAFMNIYEFADVFAPADDSAAISEQTIQPEQTTAEEESETVIPSGGRDIDFSSVDALEGVCFDETDTGFDFVTPLDDYVISSPFGYRTGPLTGEPGIHTGLDMAADYGTPVYAAADGVVADAEWDNSYGNYVKIKHINNTVSIYAHCSSLCVVAGEKVRAGDVIAEVGSTGDSTGNHLHFEVRKDNIRINPEYLLSLK